MTDPDPPRRTLLVVLFVVYIVDLAWVVIWKLDLPYVGAAAGLPRPIKLLPFAASGDAGPSAPLEVLANVLLFVPFGIFLGVLAPRWRWRSIGLFAGASLVVEIVQHAISVGSFDITDVIVNTVGGGLGLALLVLLRRQFRSRTAGLMARILVFWTVLSILAIGAFVASPLHYAQPHDVVGPLHSPAN